MIDNRGHAHSKRLIWRHRLSPTDPGDAARAAYRPAEAVVFTAGFFAAHSVASGWVSAGATSNRAQASALYLMAYYLGSSAVGAGAGVAYQHGGWLMLAAVVAVLFILGLIAAAGVER